MLKKMFIIIGIVLILTTQINACNKDQPCFEHNATPDCERTDDKANPKETSSKGESNDEQKEKLRKLDLALVISMLD